MPPLTHSEMTRWQACTRGWWLTYYRQLRRRHELPSLPNIGNLVHDGLEAYYRGELERPADLVRARADKTIAEHPDFAEQIEKDAEMATIMLDGYIEEVIVTGMDAGFEIVGVEQAVEMPVGPFKLRGKIDARLRRLIDGALLQLEHKTVANLTDIPKYAQSAPQFLTYDLLAMMLALETGDENIHTDGVLLNMLRRVKRTARAKPPFYGRHEVRHNLDELRSHYRHVVALGKEMQTARDKLSSGMSHHDVCPPNVNRDHSWQCPCREITAMFDDGSDVEAFIGDFFEPHDPWARYNTEGGE
jgi:hypothetical protein